MPTVLTTQLVSLAHVKTDTKVMDLTVMTLMNAQPIHVMLMRHVPIMLVASNVAAMLVTRVMDSSAVI
jgi:hypothetical protein